MAQSKAVDGIQNVAATVDHVDEKYLRLKSHQIDPDMDILLSAVVALGILPRPKNLNLNLLEEYRVGDVFIMDVAKDIGYYITQDIHAIRLPRSDGDHIIADGLVVSTTEFSGPVVRSKYLPDFICLPDRCIRSEIDLFTGCTVVFEALLADPNTAEGLALRVTAPDWKGLKFPLSTIIGTLCLEDDRIMVRCSMADGMGSMTLPIFEGAHHGCVAPISLFVGQKVSCLVCPSNPHLSETELEVIYFCPWGEGTVPLSERWPPSACDGVVRHGENLYERKGIRQVQCSEQFNEEIMQSARDAFMFFMERADPAGFVNMVFKYPEFTSAMLDELGLAGSGDTVDYEQFIQAISARKISGDYSTNGMNACGGDSVRTPKAPDFLPEDFMFRSSEECVNDVDEQMEAAAAALVTSGSKRPPVLPNESAQRNNTEKQKWDVDPVPISLRNVRPEIVDGNRNTRERETQYVRDGVLDADLQGNQDDSSIRSEESGGKSSQAIRQSEDCGDGPQHGDMRVEEFQDEDHDVNRSRLSDGAKRLRSLAEIRDVIQLVGHTRIDIGSSNANESFGSISGSGYKSGNSGPGYIGKRGKPG